MQFLQILVQFINVGQLLDVSLFSDIDSFPWMSHFSIFIPLIKSVLFFNDFYPVIIKECEMRGQKWEDSFHKYLLNIAWRIKDSGILSQKDRHKAVKLSMAYLAKAVKQKSKEVVFSDLTDYYNRTLGLDVFREE